MDFSIPKMSEYASSLNLVFPRCLSMHRLPTIQERAASWLLENLILREKGEPAYLPLRVPGYCRPTPQAPRPALGPSHRDSSPHCRAATERYQRQDATTIRNIIVLHCEFTGV